MKRQLVFFGVLVLSVAVSFSPAPFLYAAAVLLAYAVYVARKSSKLWQVLVGVSIGWAVTLHSYGGTDFECLSWFGLDICKVRNEGDGGPVWLGNPFGHDLLFFLHLTLTFGLLIVGVAVVLARNDRATFTESVGLDV